MEIDTFLSWKECFQAAEIIGMGLLVWKQNSATQLSLRFTKGCDWDQDNQSKYERGKQQRVAIVDRILLENDAGNTN